MISALLGDCASPIKPRRSIRGSFERSVNQFEGSFIRAPSGLIEGRLRVDMIMFGIYELRSMFVGPGYSRVLIITL